MTKIAIDPGHGASDPGAVNGSRTERDDVMRLALAIKPLLEAQGIDVLLTHDGTKPVKISERCKRANDAQCAYFLSIHRNSAAPNASGIETWVVSSATADTIRRAQLIQEAVINVAKTPNRGVKKGAANPAWGDYGVNVETNMPSCLLELGFISNEADNRLFDQHLDGYALAITKALCAVVGRNYLSPILTPIMGQPAATAAQMRAYLCRKNPAAPDYAALYLAEGSTEGVRGDILFAQSCIETDYWRFGGDVKQEQNNFCGLGATGGGVAGCSFPDAQTGIRAQAQHMQAYACDKPLVSVCVDPRYKYVQRGAAPYVEWLGIPDNPGGVGWAAAKGYGKAILDVLDAMIAEPDAGEQEPPEAAMQYKVYELAGTFEDAREARRFAAERDSNTITICT